MERPSSAIRSFVFCLFVVSAGTCVAEEKRPPERTILWQIGTSDNDTAELALGPKDFRACRRPACFVVGRSDPKRDWPYVQPGGADSGWAPGGPHTHEVWFGLQARPTGACRLTLDFVDTHSKSPPGLRVSVNDEAWEFQTPHGTGDDSVFGAPALGREHIIAIDVPAHVLVPGDNRVAVTAATGSWVLWDAVRFEAPSGTSLAEVEAKSFVEVVDGQNVLVRQQGQIVQPIRLRIRHVGPPVEAILRLGDQPPISVALELGVQRVETSLAPVDEPQTVPVALQVGGETLAKCEITVSPVRKREIHLIHQTHLDIGFTHRQEEVLQRQVGFLHKALEYVEATKDYPEDARFKWHPEGMWAIDEFLRSASEDQRERFLRAVRKGYIHLDAFYVHMMTGLGTEEELLRLLQPAKDFERKHGVEVTAAIGSDVPGYTWGLVSAMGQQGVRYLNTAPNNNHRLGFIYLHGNKPFWWVGPAGQHRVLCWMVPTSYIYFWGGRDRDVGSSVMSYVDKYLEGEEFPYDLVQIRYEVGGDNGYPDLGLAQQVKAWNEKVAWPRIVLSTNTRFFQEFERRYGDDLPELSGDLTPFWEDGAASTSADLSVNRRAKERLLQAERLWTLLCPDRDLHGDVARAWHHAVMYDEHTWGASCSISRPFDPFTVSQEEFKRQYALTAREIAGQVLEKAVAPVAMKGSRTIDVYNTVCWDRGGLVLVSADQSSGMTRVVDSAGKTVPVQRLASGELALIAPPIPALGAARFTLDTGDASVLGDVVASGNTLENGQVRVKVDPASGSIASIRSKSIGRELVDRTEGFGVNDYLYTLGRTTGQGYQRISGPVTIAVEDAGPLVGTLRVESPAPGCEKLVRRVRVHSGSARIDLINGVAKTRELQPEQVYFAFPLAVPGGQPRIDVPYAVVRPEEDQLAGANRNYYCVQRWVDVSNDEFGVTWVTRDAPMVKFHPFRIIGRGRGCLPAASFMYDTTPQGVPDFWLRHIDARGFFYSWVMTNHWECNYRAYQEGPHRFAYALLPHGKYDQAAAQRAGRDVTQPLLVVPADPANPLARPPLRVEGEGVLVSSLRPSSDGRATIVRLFAASGQSERITLQWAEPKRVYRSDPNETRGPGIEGPIDLGAYEVLTLRAEPQ